MSTFVELGLEKIESRLEEIALIIGEAKKSESKNQKLYNTLCRSAQVLLVAHLEGFIKDFTKDIVNDLSRNVKFKDAPVIIKRTYCEHFMEKNEAGKFNEKLRDKLMLTFDALNPQLSAEPFLFYNKNPSPSIVRKSLEKLSVKSFFKTINESDVNVVFSGTTTEVAGLLSRLRDELTGGIHTFPYKVDVSKFSIETSNKKSSEASTLWETFLNSILSNRHDIVHGDVITSSIYHQDIEENLVKVYILVYSITLITCSKVSSPY